MADSSLRIALMIPKVPLFQVGAPQMILTQEIGQEVTGVVENIAAEARTRAPVGVSGLLRASIGTRVTLGTDATELVHGEIFTGAQAPYALYVEEGTSPHWPPRAPIELWAARVLGNAKLWYLVARAISRRGTRARHFMRDALAAVEPGIQSRMQAALARAVRRISGE